MRRITCTAVLFLFVGFASAQETLIQPMESAESSASAREQSIALAIAAERQANADDPMRKLQYEGYILGKTEIAHWGINPKKYSDWTNHSNRMVPVYTFGMTLGALRSQDSLYTSAERLEKTYGSLPMATVNPVASYFDQTDIYHLQQQAVAAGKKQIILMVFDGMDWQTTRAAALYATGDILYDRGRGTGLPFQDYRGAKTDFGFIVTSARQDESNVDVDAQLMKDGALSVAGGYDVVRGGHDPWHEQSQRDYLIGSDRQRPHVVTDSAASATSMTAGIKTYNGAIGVDVQGMEVLSIARQLQSQRDFKIGIVTSVPISHATPASAYANNVSRDDYQDLTRDLLGLPSSFHRSDPLPGVDVLIGGGYGANEIEDPDQGSNFIGGNRYLTSEDYTKINRDNGGKYVIAHRTKGRLGSEVLAEGVKQAIDGADRFFGFFGAGSHLPYQTADGDYDPTFDDEGHDRYSPDDINENPTLAEMTTAALDTLESSPQGFWLMVESGDVDWANHANNLDSSIGAVFSGSDAFTAITSWVDERDAWDETALIVTNDHGHFLVIEDPHEIAKAGKQAAGLKQSNK